MRKKILIFGGDPKSINTEIIFKCWKMLNKSIKKKIYIIANTELLIKQFKKLKYKIIIERINNLNYKKKNNDSLKILDVDLKFKNPFIIDKKDASKYINNSLNLAHNLALRKDVLGIINCPIDKNLLKHSKLGVTELLAHKCGISKDKVVMLIFNKKLAVCPLTTHIDHKEVSKKISLNLIFNKIVIINDWYKKKFKKKPRIGLTGLNPHNAELRKNSEEIKKIIPAIKKLKKNNINIIGPLVSDTAFIDYKKYDVIVGMYHDQVLAPFKTIFKFDAINVTLGLKYIRTSPDHGTAVNLIGKNKANFLSLYNCINFLNHFGK